MCGISKELQNTVPSFRMKGENSSNMHSAESEQQEPEKVSSKK